VSLDRSAWRRRGREEPPERPPRPSNYEFSKVTANFESAGEECAGWLYRPDRPADPPVIVMAHGFAAERTFRLPTIAERFAERGYAVFLFDYRNFGDSEGEPRNLVSPSRHVADWEAAVGRVRRFDDLDTTRLALWGTSFSGGHALVTAAGDRRVSAVVGQVPFVDGRAVTRNKPLSYLSTALGAGLRDALQSRLLGPHTVPVYGDPEEFAVLNEPGARSGYEELLPRGTTWDNECPARIFLSLPRYRPITHCEDVTCPTLLLAGQHDEIIPLSSVESAAEALADATLIRMPVGHFDVYSGEAFEQAFGHQVTFLDSVLRD
jgi:pimeloyl-ACP methyl ester carboxylesterase